MEAGDENGVGTGQGEGHSGLEEGETGWLLKSELPALIMNAFNDTALSMQLWLYFSPTEEERQQVSLQSEEPAPTSLPY